MTTPERRPMFIRDWRLSAHVAGWLAAREVSPNLLSQAGLAGGLISGAALALTGTGEGGRWAFLVAAGGILLRSAGNILDGMVALASRKASPVGELFNDVPDRISDSAILIGAGSAAGGWPVLGWLAALLALFVAYVRVAGKAAGASQEYCGPMAKVQRMVIILLLALYCGVTPRSAQPVWFVLGHDCGLMAAGLAVIIAGGVATAARRLVRIARVLENTPPPANPVSP